MGEDDIVELLWKNGHVVRSSQAQTPPLLPPILRGSGSGGGSREEAAPPPLPLPQPLQPSDDKNLFISEDEMASWLHHHQQPLREEDEFNSHLFYSSGVVTTPFTQPQGSVYLTPPPPPPQDIVMYTPTPAERPMCQVMAERRAETFFNFLRLRGNIYTGGRAEAAAQWVPVVKDSAQVGSSLTPLSSSATESCLVSGGVAQTFAVPPRAAIETVYDMAGPPSSGVVSNTETEPFRIQPATETEAAAADDERKRKEREEPGDGSEETGEEARGSTSRKRSRAAEMHNISERRRREKINEKMKALQELIPRCNKTDKVSMLEDAIEYVKSLQMQIQMMSTGMPMMYTPNMQRFMEPSAMGMMGMNRPPPFIPLPGTVFPRQAHMAGLVGPPYPPAPRYPFPNVQPFDPSSVRLPTQQADPNQPQFPGFVNPYSQFVGLQQLQQPPPPTTQLQNQTTSQQSSSKASSGKEPEG